MKPPPNLPPRGEEAEGKLKNLNNNIAALKSPLSEGI
jgi:hypothetical protein